MILPPEIRPAPVLIDLSQTTYLDSVGVHMLTGGRSDQKSPHDHEG